MKLAIACLLVLCWLVPSNARADVFLFDTVVSTTGAFGCRSFLTCSGMGTSTLTVQNGTGTATLTFTGVDTSLAVTNAPMPVTLGSMALTTTPGFVFPVNPINPAQLPVIFFTLGIMQTTPAGATNAMHWAFIGGRSDLTVNIGASYSTLPTGLSNYPEMIYTFKPFPVTIVPNRSTQITADVGAVPEPASMLLLGSGLVVARLARRRKR